MLISCVVSGGGGGVSVFHIVGVPEVARRALALLGRVVFLF